ncbi:pro-sigmaK processing inhibitor BofA family protein [Desulfofalx alkaliphila]|uniref:pro-sigmaK processing inhibitor BofA family protein n=1 Tax=Desulfofalx alkaliphila TaxID=105483 RepID=UPI0004E0CE0B|nr:pro-sigmaK processing inhibitor BofA family protein [Desulfofalx alkaliphila]
MEWTTIVLGLVGLFGLYLVGIFFVRPLRLVFRALACLVVGALLLAITNVISANFGIYIPINIFTLLLAGVLQVPGVVLLVLMEYMLL